MKIITSGFKFVDIDAFACIYAYKELLDLMRINSKAFITAELNYSIISKYYKLDFYDKNLENLEKIKDKEFVIVDVSNPKHFEKFVDIDLVLNIFDHHSGFEDYWKNKIGDRATIVHIGAAATLLYREYIKENLIDKISSNAAELLALAILSNTLYFQAKITKEEDKKAYEQLKNYFSYNDNFESDYFEEVQESIEKNITTSLRSDSKSINSELSISQLEIWNANHIIEKFTSEIRSFLLSTSEEISFLNLIEIGKKRNMIIFRDKKSLNYMQKYFPEFNYDNKNNSAITPYIILRKEILHKIFSKK